MERLKSKDMTRDELRDLIIEAEELVYKMKLAWKYLDWDGEVEPSESQHLPCDSCKDRKKI